MDSNEAKLGFVITLGRPTFQDTQTATQVLGGSLLFEAEGFFLLQHPVF